MANFVCAFGHISIVANGQILKNNQAIWSHWTVKKLCSKRSEHFLLKIAASSKKVIFAPKTFQKLINREGLKNYLFWR